MINVLIACEESQASCKAFRKLGYNAYSCDIVPCTGGHPEWHIKENALNVINGGTFKLQRGGWVSINRWDLIVAHPPCTYLSNAAVASHSLKSNYENRIEGRTLERIHAQEFFMRMIQANCDHIAVENPVGIMNKVFRRPDQIIEPYQFAESVDDRENYLTKRTCLWLKNLPELQTNDLPAPNNKQILGVLPCGKTRNWTDSSHGSTNRSKTFPGVAKAFATQWGHYVEEQKGQNGRGIDPSGTIEPTKKAKA